MFPSGEDYVNAIRNINTCVLDRHFFNGRARKTGFLIEQYSGGYSRVFPIAVNNKTLALRCFVSDVTDAKHRYQTISSFLSQLHIDYFVEFAYVEQGIRIKGKVYPIIRMEWFDGDTLKNYIQKNYSNKKLLQKTAALFLQMVQTLHHQGISHGDLQDENILIKSKGTTLDIKLIDYDSLYVDHLKGSRQQIVGKPNFQHPIRIQNKDSLYANEKMDYFSELVIYISLLALAEKPSLWNKYQLDQAEGFFFEDVDFQDPSSSKIFKDLQRLSPELNVLCSTLQRFCKLKHLEELLPLETVVQQANEMVPQVVSKTHFTQKIWYTGKIIVCILVAILICLAYDSLKKIEIDEQSLQKQNKSAEIILRNNQLSPPVLELPVISPFKQPLEPVTNSERAIDTNKKSDSGMADNQSINTDNQFSVPPPSFVLHQKTNETHSSQKQSESTYRQTKTKKSNSNQPLKVLPIKAETIIQSNENDSQIIQIEQAIYVSIVKLLKNNRIHVVFDVWVNMSSHHERLKSLVPCYLYAGGNIKHFLGYMDKKFLKNVVQRREKDGVAWNKYRIQGNCYY